MVKQEDPRRTFMERARGKALGSYGAPSICCGADGGFESSLTNSLSTNLEKLDVANHISGRQQIMNQHEGAEHMGDGGLLRCIGNALMG